MNQILVSEKLYVTPELKKKKKRYKFNFILSILLMVALFGYYVYGEYQRTKQDQSQEILSQIDTTQPETDSTIKLEDDVLVVVLDDTRDDGTEVDLQALINANKNAKLDSKAHKTARGAIYRTVAVINIPSLDITYPVIYSEKASDQTIEDLLKISVVKYWGPAANQPGNFCVVGHNYHNKKFFSKASKLESGDTIYVTDVNKKTVEYRVYKNYTVKPEDLSCTSQLTNGATDITLITCTMTGKERTIVKARAVNP